jgi:predicted 2-oxoglutarate/Fe(II)-dependent dioxygenase YbiX
MSMTNSYDIRHYIQQYDIQLPNNFLDQLINIHASTLEHAKVGGTTGHGAINTRVRNCFTTEIKDTDICMIIYHQVDKCLKKYHELFPQLGIQRNEHGYIFLKYTEGCYYKEHIDQATLLINRILTIIILLNDDYEGGELSFLNKTYSIPTKKHTLIIFPSNFMFPHQVLEITKGIRYSIVTWVY